MLINRLSMYVGSGCVKAGKLSKMVADSHNGKDGALTPTECALQSTDYKSVGAYRKFAGDNAWSPIMKIFP
jgi:hypothetical protein